MADHGRLIDADALIAKYGNWYTEEGPEEGFIGTIKNLVDTMPTIERKKGRWIEDAETFYKAVNKNGGGVDANTPYFTEDDIVCSECLALFSVIDNCTECFDFCPSCGADMRAEVVRVR